MSFIEMRNIRKDFGKNTILHGVDMDLEKGSNFHYRTVRSGEKYASPMPEPFGTHPGRFYLCGRRILGTGKRRQSCLCR